LSQGQNFVLSNITRPTDIIQDAAETFNLGPELTDASPRVRPQRLRGKYRTSYPQDFTWFSGSCTLFANNIAVAYIPFAAGEQGYREMQARQGLCAGMLVGRVRQRRVAKQKDLLEEDSVAIGKKTSE
jgi:hypothetical protein